MNAPTLLARSVARILRTIRDWVYVISLAALVLALIGFLFKLKGALHVGVVAAIAANIGMLVVGVAYLVTLPFKESLHHGLSNLLIPFYAVYYWSTRWPKMKLPVKKTLGAFLPILLAGAAYLAYEDGPEAVEAVEREVPIIEEEIEAGVTRLEGGPVKAIEGGIERAVDSPRGGARGRAR